MHCDDILLVQRQRVAERARFHRRQAAHRPGLGLQLLDSEQSSE